MLIVIAEAASTVICTLSLHDALPICQADLLAPDAFAGEEGPDVGLVLVGIGGHRLHRRGELPRDGLAPVVDGGLESHRGGVGAGRRTPHLHDGPGSAVLVLVLEGGMLTARADAPGDLRAL